MTRHQVTDTTSSERPDFPPERLAKRQPTFQFPKTLLLPALKFFARSKDRGWLPGTPLKRHIVICGFPRSGTTLLQLLLESCTQNLGTCGRERRALEVAAAGKRSHSVILTKRPKDLFLIPEIASWHAANGTQALFILMHRDPRAVLTSRHFSSPQHYYLNCRDWQHFYLHWKWSGNRSDVLSVSYEALTSSPAAVQHQINRFANLDAACRFEDFLSRVPPNFDLRALNGLRQTETTRINSWKSQEHQQRLTQIFSELPELPKILDEMGYSETPQQNFAA
ncbi:MAG: sulfotransferase family protein [Planctomyces sp.]|jgi:hypothetical protein